MAVNKRLLANIAVSFENSFTTLVTIKEKIRYHSKFVEQTYL